MDNKVVGTVDVPREIESSMPLVEPRSESESDPFYREPPHFCVDITVIEVQASKAL
jgi:hypothetical protein